MTSELKPCPFCGGIGISGFDKAGWCIECIDCGVEGPHCSTTITAEAEWNTRAPTWPSYETELVVEVEWTPDDNGAAIVGIRGAVLGYGSLELLQTYIDDYLLEDFWDHGKACYLVAITVNDTPEYEFTILAHRPLDGEGGEG